MPIIPPRIWLGCLVNYDKLLKRSFHMEERFLNPSSERAHYRFPAGKAGFVGWAEGREAHHVSLVGLAALCPPYQDDLRNNRNAPNGPSLLSLVHFCHAPNKRTTRSHRGLSSCVIPCGSCSPSLAFSPYAIPRPPRSRRSQRPFSKTFSIISTTCARIWSPSIRTSGRSPNWVCRSIARRRGWRGC